MNALAGRRQLERPTRAPARRPLARGLVIVALVAALGVAVVTFTRPGGHLSVVPAAPAPPVVPSTIAPVRRVVDGVSVEVDAGASEVGRAYARVAGSVRPGTGPARCARGLSDERSWSRPTNPARPAGRYRCEIEHGRAAMWWTDDRAGRLVHAVAPDRDLAALFRWWRAHPAV